MVWGGAPPGTRTPAPWIHCCCFRCRQLQASWAGVGGGDDLRLQVEEGASADEGRRAVIGDGRTQFYSSKGVRTPNGGVGGEEGVRRARCPTGWGSRGGFWASEPGVRPYLLCPWGHLHSGPPCLPHSPLPSPAPSDTRSGTHRGKSSGGCCSQDASFCSEGEGGSGLVGKEQASPPPSSPLQQGRGLAQRPLQCQAPAR